MNHSKLIISSVLSIFLFGGGNCAEDNGNPNMGPPRPVNTREPKREKENPPPQNIHLVPSEPSSGPPRPVNTREPKREKENPPPRK